MIFVFEVRRFCTISEKPCSESPCFDQLMTYVFSYEDTYNTTNKYVLNMTKRIVENEHLVQHFKTATINDILIVKLFE